MSGAAEHRPACPVHHPVPVLSLSLCSAPLKPTLLEPWVPVLSTPRSFPQPPADRTPPALLCAWSPWGRGATAGAQDGRVQQTDTEHGRVSGCDGPPLRKRNEATGRSVKACLGRSRQPETRMSRGAGVGMSQ